MVNPFVPAAESAIRNLVSDFQANPSKWWEERDLHWSLFHYLKQQGQVSEGYPTQLIRAEFPTVKKWGTKRPARGHYDLVILDPDTYFSEAVQSLTAEESWDRFLPLVKIAVTVEIKLWRDRLPFERADWDIKKLTELSNNVLNAYFLNFVQLDFTRDIYRAYYGKLRQGLAEVKKAWPNLRILCVPSDQRVQPELGSNWL